MSLLVCSGTSASSGLEAVVSRDSGAGISLLAISIPCHVSSWWLFKVCCSRESPTSVDHHASSDQSTAPVGGISYSKPAAVEDHQTQPINTLLLVVSRDFVTDGEW
jgi:hypothetical protein